MNTKYFLYALVLTLVTTAINWGNTFKSFSTPRSSYSSGGSSGGYYGGGGGGGHK